MDPPDLDFQRSDYQIESSRPSPKLRAVSPKAKVSVFIDFSRHYKFLNSIHIPITADRDVKEKWPWPGPVRVFVY